MTTLGSNVTEYGKADVFAGRPGMRIVRGEIVFSSGGTPSTVASDHVISLTSVATGLWSLSVPSGQKIDVIYCNEIPTTLGVSVALYQVGTIVPTAGTASVIRWANNGTTVVSGVAPASGAKVSFALFIHSEKDGEM